MYAEEKIGDNRSGRCFICAVVAGEDNERHPVIYADDICLAFLDLYPHVLGHVLVCPVRHCSGVVSDFGEHEYLELQRRIHRIARAITRAVVTDRMYIYSFGSNEGYSHVHWHLAPLPPGIAIEAQEFKVVDSDDYLAMSTADRAALAAEIASYIETGA